MSTSDEILKTDVTNRIRSNHALEHATLHILQEKGFNGRMGGISDPHGFWIYGNVDIESLLLAAREARDRLVRGESNLAVHENCGTNIAVSALAAGGLAWMGMRGTKGKPIRRLLRLPVAALLGLVGYQIAKPWGPQIQARVTTNADVSGMEIVEVKRQDILGTPVHRVVTRMAD